jgi:hypothetical protein
VWDGVLTRTGVCGKRLNKIINSPSFALTVFSSPVFSIFAESSEQSFSFSEIGRFTEIPRPVHVKENIKINTYHETLSSDFQKE